MFKSYVLTALRHLRRHKGHTVINILGLAAGLACSFFILLWVQDELSYDRFHEHGEELYQVRRHVTFSDGQVFTWTAIPAPMAEVLEADYPEVEHAILYSWPAEMLVRHGEASHRPEGRWADPALFEAFTFPFVAGDPATALDDPASMVLSESLARTFFGSPQAALGQTLVVNEQDDVTVTGVFADVPANSSLQFEFVRPVQAFLDRNEWTQHWGNSGLRMLLQLRAGTDPDAFNEKVAGVIQAHHESTTAVPFVQPYQDVRLRSKFEGGQLVGGRITYVRIFALAALFVLLIATINFTNLSTARSLERAREIGVRKAIGATRGTLMLQFLGEALLLALGAFTIALVLVVVGLPTFNAITGKSVTVGAIPLGSWGLFLAIAVATGLLAGSYPAFVLASFNTIKVLRGQGTRGTGHGHLRRGLVVFQFALSILLIISTLTAFRQMEYIRTKHLGLDRENVVMMRLEGGVADQYEAFQQELLRRPGITAVSASSQNPLSIGQSTTDPTWDAKQPDQDILFHIVQGDYDFIDAMRMELVGGRTFDRTRGADSTNFVINERAAEAMGMADPVGQRLAFWGDEGTIIGVVRDFHMNSLHSAIEPTIVRLATNPSDLGMLWVRTAAGQTAEGLASLEAVYRQFNPGYPFTYRFMDDDYQAMYESEQVISQLALVFAGLAIFIACLGLFGLATFTAARRTKELGVRKVLGASVPGLVMLLTKDFVKLVAIAFVLAAPVAYWAMRNWLDGFAYRSELSPALFAGAALLTLGVAWSTVAYRSYRAASADPVRSLRTE